MNTTKIALTSSEMGILWSVYQSDSLALIMLSHFLDHVENEKIKQLIEVAKTNSEEQFLSIENIFKEEHFPIPDAFKNEAYESAPRLFSDQFYLSYVYGIGKITMDLFAYSLSNVYRQDIRNHFTMALNKSSQLFNQATDVMAEMGVLTRSPHIEIPTQVKYVKKASIMSSWLNNDRPLNTVEIGDLFFNLQNNFLGQALVTGFSQVAQTKDIRNYLLRGRDIAKKHAKVFGSFLSQGHLPVSMTWDNQPTESTTPPFSDKVMMYHVTTLIGTGITNYGLAISRATRQDLAVDYTRLSAEIMKFAEDGIKIMIQNNWFEQPPLAPDRDHLAKR